MVLKFYFKVDSEFSSFTKVVNSEPGNYISSSYVKAPLYDFVTNQPIGYKVTTSTLQQAGDNLYYIVNNSTYTIYVQGTISWNGFYENTTPSNIYPPGTKLKSNIVSTSGTYLGKTGTVKLTVQPSGQRDITVCFFG